MNRPILVGILSRVLDTDGPGGFLKGEEMVL
jgi:hypothetical protein